jgi:hypothetical protein
MRGPTRRPYAKAFAFAAIGLALGVAAIVTMPPSGGAETAGRMAGWLMMVTAIPAAVVGFVATRSTRVWGLRRIGGFWLLGLLVMLIIELLSLPFPPRPTTSVPLATASPPPQAPPPTASGAPEAAPHPETFPALPAPGDPAAERNALLAQIRAGYAQAAPGAPNLVELLAERFPADVDGMLQEMLASSPPSPPAIQRIVAKTLVAIQARDGGKLARAPGAALRQFMTAQRDVVGAAAANGTISCTAVAQAPTPEIARLSIIRLHSLLAAIAEGRDHPVDRAAASKDDFVAFARAAINRGVDVARWQGLSDPQVAASDPGRVCQGLFSMYDAAVKTEGALGERIIAGFAQDQLATSMSSYEPVLK